MDINNITAVIINYRTIELTKRAIWSLNGHYPQMPVIVLDNNSGDNSKAELEKLAKEIPQLTAYYLDSNIHHGPGMHEGIKKAITDWVLLFDSDCILYRKGLIEMMSFQANGDVYAIGKKLAVNKDGFSPAKDEGAYGYIHPHCALVNKKKYLTLPPFEKHGAPCLTNYIQAQKQGYGLKDFPVEEYVYHLGRGTVNITGYNLGAKSKLDLAKNKIKRWFK
ncbi:MAG TPA: glycosyltransferase family 2 protein [Ignavibacteriales bacterium]|nr:glycosyltransferase family 2 protein [Ignavibacteriales bacterium]